MGLEKEEWRPVVDYEGRYEVSNQGRVRSLIYSGRWGSKVREVPLVLSPAYRHGYKDVCLHKNKSKKMLRIAHLVLEAFISPRPEGMFSLHGTLGKTVDTPENLSWGTPKQNMQDKFRDGIMVQGEEQWQAKLTEEHVRYIKTHPELTTRQLAELFDVNYCTIGDVRRGTTWKHIQ